MIKQFFLLIQSCWIWITTHNKKNAHALTRLRDGMLIWLAKFLSITRLSHYTMACNHLWPLNNEEHSFQKKSSLQITFSKWKKKNIYIFLLSHRITNQGNLNAQNFFWYSEKLGQCQNFFLQWLKFEGTFSNSVY